MKKLNTLFALSSLLVLGGAALANPPQKGASAKEECNKVFTEARRLPAPTASSIRDYGNRVVEQGKKCLEAGSREIMGEDASAERAE
jgi:hypothetical protein